MHFYERIKQKFVYIYLFVLARRFYRFLKNFPNVGYVRHIRTWVSILSLLFDVKQEIKNTYKRFYNFGGRVL